MRAYGKILFLSIAAILPLYSLAGLAQWSVGVERLRNAASNEKIEIAQFYFNATISSHSHLQPFEKWGIRTEGEELGARPDFSQAGEIIQELIKAKPTKVTGCLLHTHPRHAYLAFGKMSEEDLVRRKLKGLEALSKNGILSAPPGGSDISLDFGLEEPFQEEGLEPEISSSLGVVDSLGIWYWGYISNAERKNQYIKNLGFSEKEIREFSVRNTDLNDIRVPFMIEVSRGNIPAEQISGLPSFRELLLIYAINDVKLRFVPFSQLSQENPCAGVDLK